MKLTKIIAFLLILSVIATVSVSCSLGDFTSLLPTLGENSATGKPDSRFTGEWIAEQREEDSGVTEVLVFTDKGTVEYKIDGELKIPEGTGENAETLPIDIDLSQIAEALSALNKFSVITYEVTSDTVMTLTIHTSLSSETDVSTTEYSFDGEVLVFDGTRYIRKR